MSRYKKGTQFEIRIKHWLEEKGYLVIRSAGSHGIFDLIAIPTDKVKPPKSRFRSLGFQLKSGTTNKWGKDLESFRKFESQAINKYLFVNGKDRDELYLFVDNNYYVVEDF